MFHMDNILKDDGLAYRFNFNFSDEKHYTSGQKKNITDTKLSLDLLIFIFKCLHKRDDCFVCVQRTI